MILKVVSVVVITLILAYFTLVFGELVPKRVAMKKSEGIALGMSGILYWVGEDLRSYSMAPDCFH